MNIRSMLYRAAALLGDLQALQRGPWAVVLRLARKYATKKASGAINRLLK